ncbi:FAD-dependent 5-carboxymethylaminomethyl-2-thiouridine(34) oxidoreductase MnmC [Massilia sp. IC2-476]|uniref:FAD-dependent 5-carboxymethylaminomethyl-2-thiouridine(34) oxidoreductase MnmC n=1 Tax=Massilia sp. IC2-476 TaxID=2887199 RepID=UPI001D0FF695|nr:FAD-dependent 5-carboxymethylaminomethyl-2-thiouridine(34) oxidoreductase MnmC [Massilia sp. IC2-476]MCC2974197.1 FAD-dependent 5-carboxymethylaminomethyl-2-thiouridine(34) oxidoreductase MnmC [Massilia sp. IC2-476]
MDVRAHWRGRDRYTVFDTSYGDGTRARALQEAWRTDPQQPARLHIVALANDLLPGFHRVPQIDPRLTLTLLAGPLETALAQLSAQPDYVRLDGVQGAGFARSLARIAAAGAQLEAEDLDAEQRAALQAQGFVFNGETNQAVFASRKPRLPVPPVPERRAIVVGAGLAGAAACASLCARGWQVTLVERHPEPAMEASGNLAGIFMPLLSRDDNIPTRLTRAAYLYALRAWRQLGGIGAAIEGQACGVLQLARDARHAEVSRSIAQEAHYPPEFARWLERPEAEALLGLPAPSGGWLFPQGGWARPGSVCQVMLDACGGRLVRRFGVGSITLEREREEWLVRGEDGQVVARAPTVVLANGAGARSLAQSRELPLSALRGQVTHLASDSVPALPLVLCREAYLTPAAGGITCAGATYDLDGDPQLRASSHLENIERLRGLVSDPAAAEGAPLAGRVGFRCVAPDRLPLVGHLPDFAAAGATERLRDVPRHPGLHALLGYASRGLIWAPLAAELLAAQLEGEPLPLEMALVDALDPARFVLRARRSPRGPQSAE